MPNLGDPSTIAGHIFALCDHAKRASNGTWTLSGIRDRIAVADVDRPWKGIIFFSVLTMDAGDYPLGWQIMTPDKRIATRKDFGLTSSGRGLVAKAQKFEWTPGLEGIFTFELTATDRRTLGAFLIEVVQGKRRVH